MVLEEFETITKKPVKTIIFTTLNPDLVSGAQAFLEKGDGDVEIIIPEDLLEFYNGEYGSDKYNLDVSNFDQKVTHTFLTEFSIDISGVKVNLFFNAGEHSDQTYLFLPEDDGILLSDSHYGLSPIFLELETFLSYLDYD
jgi:glyoxylase-like metal-dependent hydrolase (beta-lactamase superfamily II)